MTQAPQAPGEMTAKRMFPVHSERAFVPWEMVLLHERQAKKNHGQQSVERLAERGGLSWCELCAVLEDRLYQKMDPREAIARVLGHTIKFLSTRDAQIRAQVLEEAAQHCELRAARHLEESAETLYHNTERAMINIRSAVTCEDVAKELRALKDQPPSHQTEVKP